ncbi:MAG: TRAP transporter substrate-binding protein DctP [Deltaproteobacteria bacterium]|nr:TRAP transporter substrate-binding protein DctP [Deltaproteobacteria bacterium]
MTTYTRRKFLKGIAVGGLAAASIGFPAVLRRAQAAPTVLKFGTYEPAQAFSPVKVLIPWINKINQAGEGVLKIDFYPNGQLGPDPTQQLKMIIDGVADITLGASVPYTPGRFPEATVTNVPFVAYNMLEATIAVHNMYLKNAFSGWRDIIPLSMNAQAQYFLHTIKPVRSPKDMAGLKIRTAGKMQQDLILAAGGTPVAESISKVAENISRNVMQGTVGEWQGMETFRVVDVAKCHTYIPFGTNLFPIVISKRSFDKLPAAAKDILLKHSGLELGITYSKEWDDFNAGVEKRERADPRSTNIDLDETLAAEWKKALDSAVQGWLKTDKRFPPVYEMYIEEVTKAREYIKTNKI